MPGKLDAHLHANKLTKNRKKLLEEYIQQQPDPNIVLVVKGNSASPAISSIGESLQKPTRVEYVEEWADYVPMNDRERLVFVNGAVKLTPDAITEFMSAFDGGADIVYADESLVPVQREEDVFYKPNWSPELLLTFQYIGSVVGVTAKKFNELGRFSKDAGGAAFHDFLLRVDEKAKVVHIPRILYSNKKDRIECNLDDLIEDTKFIIEKALRRQGISGTAVFTGKCQANGCPTYYIEFPDVGPSVAILIASRNKLDILLNCLESLKKTTYKNYSITIVDNDSDNEEMLDWLGKAAYRIISVDRPDGKFNFAYVYNTAIAQVEEEYVLLLNSDTVVINPKWLSGMVGYAQLSGVGSVGARLIFGHGAVQHAGIYHNMRFGFPVTAFRHLPQHEDGYWQLSRLSCNHMAETAACLLTRRELYLEAGGLDEKSFAVAFNDCDYGYRLHGMGYRNVICPTAELYHLENATRGSVDNPAEEAAYIKKYSRMPDKYHNPNFEQGEEACRLSSRTIETIPVQKFRLLMVMHDLTRTGACRNACFLAQEIKKRGVIETIVLSHLDGPLRAELESAGIEVRIMEHFNLLHAETEEELEIQLQEMLGWIEDLKPDVIYGNTILTFWAMGAAKEMGIPCVWNIRESEEPFSHFDEHGAAVKPFAIKCMAYPYQVIFVADATKNVFEDYLNNNAITIHNGFDRKYFEEQCQYISREDARSKLLLSDTELYILNVGTICERKGQEDVFEAFVRLPSEMRSRCRLGLVSGSTETPYRLMLKDRLNSLPLEIRERITIFEDGGNIDYHYMAADIFVCTSRIESFPRIIQEAMSCSLPIITTPVFGIVEQVTDGVSAVFYTPGDTEMLCNKLSELIVRPDVRNKLGKQAGIALDILPGSRDMVDAYERVFREAWLSGECRPDGRRLS